MEDLRIRRTKKLIIQAFYHLLQKEDFDKITIQQIADGAMINRQTFYLHYQDKYDLLQQIIDKICAKADKILAEKFDNLDESTIKIIQNHYNELVNDADEIKLLLSQDECRLTLGHTMRQHFLALLKKYRQLHLTAFQAKVMASNFTELVMAAYDNKNKVTTAELEGLYALMKKLLN